MLFENKNKLFSNALGSAGNDTPEEIFIAEIAKNENLNKQKIIDLAKKCGVQADETQIKELYEVAIMRSFKKRITSNIYKNYQIALEIYGNQVNFAHRTSNSVSLQQYSTPLPLAYIAGAYVNLNNRNLARFLEPSAGNGLLTVALDSWKVTVNEIDRNRRNNLEKFGEYAKVTNKDGSKPFDFIAKGKEGMWGFDGIITNPPFGRWNTEKIGGYPIQKLEFIMSIRALDTMKDGGRAAIIIGGHTIWDEFDRVENGANRYFLSYLYHFYNVDDVINIYGQMYAKQGTSFPIRLILINGRKAKPDGTAPLKTAQDRTVRTFDELWERMAWCFGGRGVLHTPDNDILAEMQAAIAEMEREIFGTNH